ncbi:MAG TPA: XdhC/CoxI family protein [Bacteroidales bacterium]|nr:XdhC/CoxI family protein [Bacteroidales bacterium]HSA42843.1 XdhC/CoxI family protein [Bacteroidales bacterium]
MSNILLRIGEVINDPRASALCIVAGTRGSSPGRAGAKMIVFSDGSTVGSVGGGGIEQQVIADALSLISSHTPHLKEYRLQEDLDMACGGAMSIYIEPLSKPSRLYIFGAGHIGKSLAKYAPDMGFETWLMDRRSELLEKEENPHIRKICKPYLDAAAELPFDRDSYIVIVTPDHDTDEAILAAVGKKEVAYLGMIGSKRKIASLTNRFLEEKILTREELDRVDMPIGIRFNAVAPAEIAISILARLIDVKNNRTKGL